MKLYIFGALIAAVVIVECTHTFMGTNVQRELVFHQHIKYNSYLVQKRVETLNISIPYNRLNGRSIQGILAYDTTNSAASANVTAGGLGYSYVNLRMKSGRAKDLQYDIYVYV